jgi:3-oxoacyl-[acyl-carrier-protein] synthase III
MSSEEQALVPRNAIALASHAGKICFENSQYKPDDIDLLVHAGVHRDEFICEPAIAALIAGQLKLNDDVKADSESKTFAYDIINGAVSFLNACHNGVAMINSGKAKSVMVVASEIDNNLDFKGQEASGLRETGCAAILDTSPGKQGFRAFRFSYFTNHVDKYYSYIGQEKGKSYLDVTRDPKLDEYYLECIPQAVQEFLDREELTAKDINVLFPPLISTEFVDQLTGKLAFGKEQIHSVANGKDYFTSSAAYGLHDAQTTGRVKSGDLGLIVNVGTGIQVACALYEF